MQDRPNAMRDSKILELTMGCGVWVVLGAIATFDDAATALVWLMGGLIMASLTGLLVGAHVASKFSSVGFGAMWGIVQALFASSILAQVYFHALDVPCVASLNPCTATILTTFATIVCGSLLMTTVSFNRAWTDFVCLTVVYTILFKCAHDFDTILWRALLGVYTMSALALRSALVLVDVP